MCVVALLTLHVQTVDLIDASDVLRASEIVKRP